MHKQRGKTRGGGKGVKSKMKFKPFSWFFFGTNSVFSESLTGLLHQVVGVCQENSNDSFLFSTVLSVKEKIRTLFYTFVETTLCLPFERGANVILQSLFLSLSLCLNP